MLQSKHSYTGEPVTVAPMDLDLLSVPSGNLPRDLGGLVGDEEEVRRFCKEFQLPKEEAERCLEAEGLKAPYYDPKLRGEAFYAKLLRLLDDSGMLEWGASCVEAVGFFAW